MGSLCGALQSVSVWVFSVVMLWGAVALGSSASLGLPRRVVYFAAGPSLCGHVVIPFTRVLLARAVGSFESYCFRCAVWGKTNDDDEDGYDNHGVDNGDGHNDVDDDSGNDDTKMDDEDHDNSDNNEEEQQVTINRERRLRNISIG